MICISIFLILENEAREDVTFYLSYSSKFVAEF